MSRVQSVRHLESSTNNVRCGESVAFDSHGKVFAIHELHGDEMDAVRLANLEYLGDVRVVDGQIAEALEAGHDAGVIHRDLKPANIKLKEDGTVKVLDYGLAKALDREEASGADPGLSSSPTLTRHGTQVGVILGTAGYMSPEQARGKRVDKRADIWSFGCVLFELLTGTRAFDGEDVTETLAAVVKSEPECRDIPLPAFDRADVRPMQPSNLRQRLLRQTSLVPELS